MSADPAAYQAEVNRIANAASRMLGDAILDFAEQQKSVVLDEGEVFLACLTGATTGALKVLKATTDVGMIADAPGRLEALLRQMADLWGQLQDQPITNGRPQ